MKIAIEALGIHDYGGGRTATINLLENLITIDQENQYLVVLNRAEPGLLARNLQQLVLPIQNRFLVRLLAQAYLPIRLRSYDLIHFAKNLGVFGMKIPSIVTMYDMTTLMHPELLPAADVAYWRHLQPYTLKQARQIIAISQTTADDIGHFYGIEAGKIKVVYPSIHSRFQLPREELIAKVRMRYGLPENYFLHVGRIDTKNNIRLLIEAFALFCDEINPDFHGALVIVGGQYPKNPDRSLEQIAVDHGLDDRVIFTDRVPDAHLPSLYGGALAMVVPSIHEGFGLAGMEAMACGTPLIANRTGAIPEVVEDAALLIDGMDQQSLALGLDKVANDPEIRATLRAQGLIRAQKYQNKNDARQTLEIYKNV